LKMLRSVGDGQTRLRGERLDGALPLRQQFEHFETVRTRERFPDTGEETVEAIFENSVRGARHKPVINRILEYGLSSGRFLLPPRDRQRQSGATQPSPVRAASGASEEVVRDCADENDRAHP